MALRTMPMTAAVDLGGRSVFLSASIPDPERWTGHFEPLEITDAVVAAGRAVLTSGGVLVTAAHPTIAPLLLYVAAELPPPEKPRVVVYQSRLFERILPEATTRFEEQGVGRLVWTDPVEGDEPAPGRWERSLDVMRRTMLADTNPAAAVFIGGMSGITDEFQLFGEMYGSRPRYALGRPGGEARSLTDSPDVSLADELREGDIYPALFRRVIAHLSGNISSE